MNFKPPLRLFLLLALLTGLLLSGCGQAAVVVVPASPTSTAVPATSTPQPTATLPPLPTATPTSTATQTPLPTATQDRTATVAAMATFSAEQVNALLNPTLEAYGVDPADGHFAWLGVREVRLDLTNFLENQDHLLEEAGALSDFVIQTKITWDTSGALSMCGITFHADEDFAKGPQNKFFLMRLQFDPHWTIWRWEFGQFQNFVTRNWVQSRNIHDKNGSTNVVALVVRGKDIDIFINHDKQLRVEDTKYEDTKHKAGWLALSAHQESGRTTCRFENTWVWAFDK